MTGLVFSYDEGATHQDLDFALESQTISDWTCILLRWGSHTSRLRLCVSLDSWPRLLCRSDTDWTWTLHLSSHWSTRLRVIDPIFWGSRLQERLDFLHTAPSNILFRLERNRWPLLLTEATALLSLMRMSSYLWSLFLCLLDFLVVLCGSISQHSSLHPLAIKSAGRLTSLYTCTSPFIPTHTSQTTCSACGVFENLHDHFQLWRCFVLRRCMSGLFFENLCHSFRLRRCSVPGLCMYMGYSCIANFWRVPVSHSVWSVYI